MLFSVKLNKSLQICVNYQKLNTITKRNWYSISLIKETLIKITNCKNLIKLNIIAAFNKLRINSDSENLTIFIISMRVNKYYVLSFELINSSVNYQHYMNNVLWDHLNDFCSAYSNDILIYSKTLKNYIQHVYLVLQKLIDVDLQVNIEKYEFHV